MSPAVFDKYAAYYDLLYRDKDYASEVDYVERLITTYGNRGSVRKLLDVGCGTGRHAAVFANRGYTVVGIDASDRMIARAREVTTPRSNFLRADARDFDLNDTFPVVVSLFHVASYQVESSDLHRYFEAIARHLVPSGLFVFDCWYGPAVFHLRPVVRVKELEDANLRIVRIATPELEPERNCVVVNYDLYLEDKADHSLGRLQESHRMRYLFVPEIEEFLARAGLVPLHSEEWLTQKPLGLETWSACFVARKRP